MYRKKSTSSADGKAMWTGGTNQLSEATMVACLLLLLYWVSAKKFPSPTAWSFFLKVTTWFMFSNSQENILSVCVSICVEKVFPLKVYIFVYILLKEKNHLVLLVVVEILENLAFLANASNLVLYLRKYMHFSPSKSANNVTNFMGTAFLLALLGGFLSDAFFTTYNIYLISAVIELLVSYTLNFQTLLFHIHTYFSHRNSLC